MVLFQEDTWKLGARYEAALGKALERHIDVWTDDEKVACGVWRVACGEWSGEGREEGASGGGRRQVLAAI